MRLTILAALFLALPAPAQFAVHGTYAPSCHGVTLSHAGKPTLGSRRTFQTWLGSTWGHRLGVFLIGTQPSGLIAFRSGGETCYMGVYPVAMTLGVTDGVGTWIVRWEIPPQLALMGVRVDEQFWLLGHVWMTSNHGYFIMGI